MTNRRLISLGSYEVFAFFFPGLVSIMAVVVLLPEGVLTERLSAPSLLSLGFMSAVVTGFFVHALAELFEDVFGRTHRELFRQRLGGPGPRSRWHRLREGVLLWLGDWVPIDALARVEEVPDLVAERFWAACEDEFGFERGELLEDPEGTAQPTSVERGSTGLDRVPGWVRSLGQWVPLVSSSGGGSETGARPGEASGEVSETDAHPGEVSETDALPGEQSDWTSAEWTMLYVLVRERVAIDGQGRALKFQALYGFSKGMSVSLAVVLVVYLLIDLESVGGCSATSSPLLSLFGSTDCQPAVVPLVLAETFIDATHVYAALAGGSVLFYLQTRQFKKHYVDMLIADTVSLRRDATAGRRGAAMGGESVTEPSAHPPDGSNA